MSKPIQNNTKDNIPAFHARTIREWRQWLSKNGKTEKSVSLIIYHKKSSMPSVYYEEAVEHALCYGWIDSKGTKRDEESSYLFFTPRKPNSKWSKPNKLRVEKMVAKGFMMPAGQALIDHAKETGTWDALKDAENGVIPDDLQQLFNKNKTAFENFQGFSDSVKRLTLAWIMDAKKPETRSSRIEKTIEMAEKGLKAV